MSCRSYFFFVRSSLTFPLVCPSCSWHQNEDETTESDRERERAWGQIVPEALRWQQGWGTWQKLMWEWGNSCRQMKESVMISREEKLYIVQIRANVVCCVFIIMGMCVECRRKLAKQVENHCITWNHCAGKPSV